MSILDRVHNREQKTGQRALTVGVSRENGSSITPEAKPPIIARLEYVVNTLHGYIAENDESGTMARFSFVTRAMIEELGEELADRDEATLAYFMDQMGEVISWIGHGDSERLPENLRSFVQPRAEIEQTAS